MPLLLLPVRDDVVLDSVVNFTRYNAVVEQILFRPIRAKAYDTLGPCAGHPGRFHQFVHRGVVDIDSRFGRNYLCMRCALMHWRGESSRCA